MVYSDWSQALTSHDITPSDAVIEQLSKSRISLAPHKNFGFDAWWDFFTAHNITPRVSLMLALAADGLQAGDHPYWGLQTWFAALSAQGVTPTVTLALQLHKAKLWATDPWGKGDGYAKWSAAAGGGPAAVPLVLAARDAGVTFDDFATWLASDEGLAVLAEPDQFEAYSGGSASKAPSTDLNFVSAAQLGSILSHLGDNPRLFASGNFATPHALVTIVDEALETYTLHLLNPQAPLPDREGVTLETCFVGPGMRRSPRLRYVPCRLSLVGTLLSSTLRPAACLISVSPPRNGRVSLGIETNIVPSAIEATRANGGLIIAQVNEHMPYTYGDSELDATLIDYAYESAEKLPSISLGADDAVADKIGANIARLVPDGATLQLGIGAIPDAVLSSLSTQRNLSVWTEMFSDGVLDLLDAGRLNLDSPLFSSFTFGSARLYEWLHLNPAVCMLRTEVINDPGRIAARASMVSVNAALQVDLYAQANASWVKGRIFSGFGGSTDFIVGALHSPGGQAFIALPSWHEKSSTSTIVPTLTSPATSFQHTAVVTEQGVARVFGTDIATQASRIIDRAAHPDAREALRVSAAQLGL